MSRPARARRHRPSRGVDRPRPCRTTSRRSRRRSRRISPGKTEYFQHEHRIRHEDGTYRRFLCRGVAVRRRRPPPGPHRRIADRHDRRRRSRRSGCAASAFLDPLTGLCNRAVFVEGLGRRLDEFKQRRGGSRFAVLYLDLDRFKVVNDSLGHLVGDELLIAVSRRLESCLRQGDALARLGGDEFAILLNELERRRAGQRHRVPHSGGAERAVFDRRPRSVHLREHRHRLRPAPLQQPRRDHARRRHRDVSREVARQGAPRAVRRRHARARARPARPRERSAPRRQQQRLRGALSADRPAGLGHVRRVRVAGPVDAQRRSRSRRPRSSRSPRSSG